MHFFPARQNRPVENPHLIDLRPFPLPPSVLAAEQPVLQLHDRGDSVALALRREKNRLVAEPARLRKPDIVRGHRADLTVKVHFAPQHGPLGKRHVVEGRQHRRHEREVHARLLNLHATADLGINVDLTEVQAPGVFPIQPR